MADRTTERSNLIHGKGTRNHSRCNVSGLAMFPCNYWLTLYNVTIPFFSPMFLAKISGCSKTAPGAKCRCAAWEQNSSFIHGEILLLSTKRTPLERYPDVEILAQACKTEAPDAIWCILGDSGHPPGIVSSLTALSENSCSGASHWRFSREECSRSHWAYMFRQLNWVNEFRSDSTLWIASFPYGDNSIRDYLSTGLKWCFWVEVMVKIQIDLVWKMW